MIPDLHLQLTPRIELGALPTPIVPLPGPPAAPGIDVDLKRDDLIGDLLTGTKVRSLSFFMQQALEDGVTDLITLGEATSNQCRLVAMLGARFEMPVHLLLRESPHIERDDENVALLNLFGARLDFLSEAEWRLHGMAAKRLMSRLRKEGRKALFLPFGCGGLPGSWGIVGLMKEILAHPDGHSFNKHGPNKHGSNRHSSNKHCRYSHLLVPTGSGASLFGLDLAAQLLEVESPPRLIGVSVSQDAASLERNIDGHYAQARRRLGLPLERSDRLHIDDSYRDLAPAALLEEARKIVEKRGFLPDPMYVLRSFLTLERLLEAGEIEQGSRVLLLVSGACRTFHVTQQRAFHSLKEVEHAIS